MRTTNRASISIFYSPSVYYIIIKEEYCNREKMSNIFFADLHVLRSPELVLPIKKKHVCMCVCVGM